MSDQYGLGSCRSSLVLPQEKEIEILARGAALAPGLRCGQ
jgi:hypothetical protein